MSIPASDAPQTAGLKGWDYIAILKQQRRILYVTLALFIFLAVVLRFVIPQKYESRIVTIPASTENDQRPAALDALASLGFSLGGSANPKEAAIATLNSRQFQTDFIRRYNLAPKLFPDKWDASSSRWKGKPPTDEDCYDALHAATTVDSAVTDNLITVRVRWTDSKLAAWIANNLILTLNQKFRNRSVAEADRMISYLTEAYTNVQITEVRTNIANLIQDQIRKRILAKSRDEFSLTVIDPAFPTVKRITPGLGVMLPLAILLGSLVGIILAFFAHATNMRWPRPLARLLAPRQ